MSVSATALREKSPRFDTVNKLIEAQIITEKELKEVQERLASVLSPYGFECHPFKIGWYNEQVAECFHLPYHSDTLSFIIISTPSMFEKAFIPFLKLMDCASINRDPIDQCMIQCFSAIKEAFSNTSVEIIHDFEMTPNRRPKVLVQTAGHVAGAVRFYQRKDLTFDPWDPKKKVFGVCLHPSYGGWFALRGVAIFTTLKFPQLPRQQPRLVIYMYSTVLYSFSIFKS